MVACGSRNGYATAWLLPLVFIYLSAPNWKDIKAANVSPRNMSFVDAIVFPIGAFEFPLNSRRPKLKLMHVSHVTHFEKRRSRLVACLPLRFIDGVTYRCRRCRHFHFARGETGKRRCWNASIVTGLTSLDVAISVNSNNAGKVYRSSWLWPISILCRIQLNGGKGKTLHFPHFSLKRVPLFSQTHLTVSGSNHRLVVSGSAIGGGGGVNQCNESWRFFEPFSTIL